MNTAELDRAIARLQSLASSGAKLGTRRAAEHEYSIAYQRLVRRGAMPQIRRKYR